MKATCMNVPLKKHTRQHEHWHIQSSHVHVFNLFMWRYLTKLLHLSGDEFPLDFFVCMKIPIYWVHSFNHFCIKLESSCATNVTLCIIYQAREKRQRLCCKDFDPDCLNCPQHYWSAKLNPHFLIGSFNKFHHVTKWHQICRLLTKCFQEVPLLMLVSKDPSVLNI